LEPAVRNPVRHHLLRTRSALPEQPDVLALSASSPTCGGDRPLSAPCCAP
jgi:hypothetical protein